MQTCGNHPKAFGTLLQFPALHPSWRLRQSQCWRIRAKQHGRPGMMPLWQTARGALIEMTTRFYAFFVFNILVCNLCLCVFISFFRTEQFKSSSASPTFQRLVNQLVQQHLRELNELRNCGVSRESNVQAPKLRYCVVVA